MQTLNNTLSTFFDTPPNCMPATLGMDNTASIMSHLIELDTWVKKLLQLNEAKMQSMPFLAQHFVTEHQCTLFNWWLTDGIHWAMYRYRQLSYRLKLLYDNSTPWVSNIGNTRHIEPLIYSLMTCIYRAGKTRDFQQQIIHERRNRERSFISTTHYLEALFNQHARLLAVRVDFTYRDVDCLAKYDADAAKQDLKRFLNNLNKNTTLNSPLCGYIWKLEYGEDRGCHFHLLFLLNGREVCRDIHWAQQLGEYWVKVTEQRGQYWNGNANKQQYINSNTLGIGMIHRDDAKLRDNLCQHVLSYFFKEEQFLPCKSNSRLNPKSFGRGEVGN